VRYRRFPGLLVLLLPCLITACQAGNASLGSSRSGCGRTDEVFPGLLACAGTLANVRGSRQVSMLLVLRDPGAKRRAAELAAMYDPRSPRFERFGSASQADEGSIRARVQRVAAVLRRHALTADWVPGAGWISARGSASAVASFFHIRILRYRAPDGHAFITSGSDPPVPAVLRRDVVAASRVETYRYPKPLQRSGDGMAPADIRSLYDINPLRSAGMTGAGETIVFFEIDGYRQDDLNAFTQRFNLPPMHPVIRAGPSLQPGGEAPMDLEAAHAIAPGARLLVYNLDQSQASSDSQFLDQLISFQQKIVAESRGAIVSNSVGSCALALGNAAAQAFRGIYDRADALGEAWFGASGDQGAYDCLQAIEQDGTPPARRDIAVDLPASAPGVTGVGGTRERGSGGEAAWEGPAETSGGGGGVSGFFSRPSWQKAPGVGDLVLDPHHRREVPDVSAIADPATSGAYVINGNVTVEGGTSQAAPIWAGIMALVDEYLTRHGARKLGFANPALYALARGSWPYRAFHDVTVGGNLVYPATQGYDMASGLGTPDAWNLARDLLAYSRGRRP
jgi:kumamolisin